MRRSLVLTLLCSLLVCLLPMNALAAPPGAGSLAIAQAPLSYGTPVTVRASNGLRLRIGPNLADPIILVLYNGETVYTSAGPVWEQGISWTFVRVYRGGYYHEGFCASAYLSNYGGYEPTGESGLKVTAGALNLRSGPGLGYAVRRTVPYGTVLQPTGLTQWSGGRQWTRVAIDGIYLWAASAYLVAV